MKILLTIITILLTTGFHKNQKKFQVLNIVTKYVVYDENVSPNLKFCSHKIKEFKKMNTQDCSFLLENQEYDIQEKFILDTYGKLKEYWIYKPMGPITYNLNELKNDQKLSDLIGANNLKIKSSSDYIIDSGDTLKIEKIYYTEKLILVERNSKHKKKQQRLIFEFE